MTKKPFVYGKYTKEEELALDAFKRAYTGCTSVTEFEPTEYGVYYDVWGKNKNGQVEHIELKLRKDGSDKFSTCFIETEKWHNLLKDFRERQEKPLPIYINFIGDASNVYVWDLSKVKHAEFHGNICIDGEMCDRIGLSWKDAWHFVQDAETGIYNIVNRGN